MSVVYLGGMSVGSLAAGAAAGIAVSTADLQARISALLAFQPQPVSLSAQLSLALATLQSVQAAIAVNLPMPDISAQIAIVLAQLGVLQTQMAGLAALEAAFSAGGLHVYATHGDAASLAADLGSVIPSDGHLAGNTDALLVATNQPSAWAALGVVMTTS